MTLLSLFTYVSMLIHILMEGGKQDDPILLSQCLQESRDTVNRLSDMTIRNYEKKILK